MYKAIPKMERQLSVCEAFSSSDGEDDFPDFDDASMCSMAESYAESFDEAPMDMKRKASFCMMPKDLKKPGSFTPYEDLLDHRKQLISKMHVKGKSLETKEYIERNYFFDSYYNDNNR